MKFTFLILLFIGQIGSSANLDLNYKKSVSIYNGLKTSDRLIDFVFASDKKTTTEDIKFLQQLRNSVGQSNIFQAKIIANAIFLDGNKIKIEIVNAPLGEYLINGNRITVSPDKPLKVTFKEIQNALNSKFSKFNLFINKAEALGLLLTVPLSIYGLGAIVTGGGCAFIKNKFGDEDKKSFTAVAKSCSKTASAWLYQAWKFYDSLVNSQDILEGECVAGGPNNKFGNLVRLRLNDESSSGQAGQLYFQANADKKQVRIFLDGFDPYNKTTGELHPLQPGFNFLYFGDDETAASLFFNELQNKCATGGTTALSAFLKDPKIKKGLTNLAKESNKKRSAENKKSPASNLTSDKATN